MMMMKLTLPLCPGKKAELLKTENYNNKSFYLLSNVKKPNYVSMSFLNRETYLGNNQKHYSSNNISSAG